MTVVEINKRLEEINEELSVSNKELKSVKLRLFRSERTDVDKVHGLKELERIAEQRYEQAVMAWKTVREEYRELICG